MKTNNQYVLEDAALTQAQTKESVQRMQRQLAETDVIGSMTLADLEDKGTRVNNISREADRLNAILDNTKRLQDRFAGWSLTFGTRRQARKLARAERDEERHVQAMERDGIGGKSSRCVKNSRVASDATNDQDPWFREDPIGKTKKNEEQSKRNELFGANAESEKARSKPDPEHTTSQAEGAPLSQNEQDFLESIESVDNDIDSELDVVSKQVERLMKMATSMGEETEQQNQTLTNVTDDMDKANHKQRVINHRAHLFTMKRREKRKNRRMVDDKAALAAKLSLAAVGS